MYVLQQAYLIYCAVCHTRLAVVHCMLIGFWVVQESEGNILDDEVLVNTLNNSKLTAGKQNLLVPCHDGILHIIRFFLHCFFRLHCASVMGPVIPL